MVLLKHRKQNKHMRIQKLKTKLHFTRQTMLFASIMLILGSAVGVPIARADTIQDQINALQNQNSATQNQVSSLQVQADGLQATINSLQVQIDGLQAQIDTNTAKSNDLQNQIAAAQAQLDQQKKVLGENIKAMYLEGDISTIEMLATSKDLSDYFDKEQYRSTVKDKIKNTLDTVTALKSQLKDQQTQLTALIAQQTTLQNQVSAQKSEQSSLLSLNQDQQSTLDSQLKANYAKLSDLRRQQAAALLAATGTGGSSQTGSSVVFKNLTGGVQCGGGYPSEYCGVPLDTFVWDPWGLYSARECVHYVAWAATQRGAHIPNLSGRGNANQWASSLSGVATVDHNPTGAMIAYLPIGGLGHVVMIDQDYGNGWLHVSQYNWQPGMYSEMDLKVTSNLLFFHF